MKNLQAARAAYEQAKLMSFNGPPPPMGHVPPSLPIQKVQLAPVPQAQPPDARPTIIEWKLRTLKGAPVLEITCVGQRAYKTTQVVNQDDYRQIDPDGYKWRGYVQSATVYLFSGEVRQSVQIALEKHTLIENGTYKLKSVLASQPKQPAPAQQSTQPSRPASSTPAISHERPRRKFHLE